MLNLGHPKMKQFFLFLLANVIDIKKKPSNYFILWQGSQCILLFGELGSKSKLV